MNKKGFTLIELLAVIVILAVIALIAVPIILKVIETSKQGAIKDSAYGVIESAEMYLARNLKNGISETMTFTCSNNKCVSDNDEEVNFKGKVENGTLLLTPSGKSVVCVDDGEHYAYKLESEVKVTSGAGTCGAYEEANGEFKIEDDLATLKNKYAAQIQELENENAYLKSLGTATAGDIAPGKTAVINGVEVVGTGKQMNQLTVGNQYPTTGALSGSATCTEDGYAYIHIFSYIGAGATSRLTIAVALNGTRVLSAGYNINGGINIASTSVAVKKGDVFTVSGNTNYSYGMYGSVYIAYP